MQAIINKRNVQYKFIDFGTYPNGVEHLFPEWKNETFDVFEQVKDKQAIAIDLGAWIGKTAISLSKNFFHVISVEPDQESSKSLSKNQEASECSNVNICCRPIAGTQRQLIFRTRGNLLNESISFLKSKSTNERDYAIETLTFQQRLGRDSRRNP